MMVNIDADPNAGWDAWGQGAWHNGGLWFGCMIGDDPDAASDALSESDGEEMDLLMMAPDASAPTALDPWQAQDPWKPSTSQASDNEEAEDEHEYREYGRPDADRLSRLLAEGRSDESVIYSEELVSYPSPAPVVKDSSPTPVECKDESAGALSSSALASPPQLGSFALMVNAHRETHGYTSSSAKTSEMAPVSPEGLLSAAGTRLATQFFQIGSAPSSTENIAPNSADKGETPHSLASPSGICTSTPHAHTVDVDNAASESPVVGADAAGNSHGEAIKILLYSELDLPSPEELDDLSMAVPEAVSQDTLDVFDLSQHVYSSCMYLFLFYSPSFYIF